MSHPIKPSHELPDDALNALIARERARTDAPLTQWHTLSARLRDEGLMRTPEAAAAPNSVASHERQTMAAPQSQRGGRTTIWQWGVRIVAGAALVGIGVFVGRAGPMKTHETQVAKAPVAAPATPAPTTVAANAENDANADNSARLVSNTEPFASPEAAKQVLLKAQSDYQRAAAYLAASDTSAQIVMGKPHSRRVYQERLAALDAVMSATQQALKDSPHDPLLHQYYQSAAGAHEATVQQLAQVEPVGMQVSRF